MQGVCRGRNFTAKWVITGGECNKLSPIPAHLNSISILPVYRMHPGSQACMCGYPTKWRDNRMAAVQSPGQVGTGVGLGLSFQAGRIPVEKPE